MNITKSDNSKPTKEPSQEDHSFFLVIGFVLFFVLMIGVHCFLRRRSAGEEKRRRREDEEKRKEYRMLYTRDGKSDILSTIMLDLQDEHVSYILFNDDATETCVWS